ncbi:uncharacterized protein DNG_03521 [Cephalotrichum gorgonifer]|uniref:AMP-dependent synthetase/ligase domain-containing protein n=1 Tax=Cephalotrichum gorgonifer TaxID=2041049 RepID=A0AAE8MWW7_9PEZI|nr:uncharacterized protein DNG_03521 [Cephalotrichum gorgonifer]
MGAFDNIMVSLDESLTSPLAQWNIYTTALAGLLAAGVTYAVATGVEPDTHPLRLARQSLPNMVRQEGESAFYRSAELGGGELRRGLEVRKKGESKWARGRDGDLRDVWRAVVEGDEAGARGKLLTIHGTEKVKEHSIEDITRQINLIGQHISHHGGIRVAIYLPNSIELLVTLFACSFYPNLTTILIPFDVTADSLVSMLRRSAADTVIAAPGTFSFDSVVKTYPALRNLIWVVDDGSAHMDWNEVPEGTGGSVNVATWREIVDETPVDIGRELPEEGGEPKDIVTFWQGKPGTLEEMVRFTQANIVAGMAGILGSVPTNQRMGPTDVLLPADSLTSAYTLVVTLTGLFCHASVALNSVAGRSTDLVLATQGLTPTILVASPKSLAKIHAESAAKLDSAILSAAHRSLLRTLAQGALPSPTSLAARSTASARPALGTSPSRLRLVYVGARASGEDATLSEAQLADLRVFLGARIVYALTAARVAGAVAQTWAFDYRVSGEGGGSHFGPPTVSTEIILRDSGAYKVTDEKVEGEIIAKGPAVAGGEAALGIIGRIRKDNTLALV